MNELYGYALYGVGVAAFGIGGLRYGIYRLRKKEAIEFLHNTMPHFGKESRHVNKKDVICTLHELQSRKRYLKASPQHAYAVGLEKILQSHLDCFIKEENKLIKK